MGRRRFWLSTLVMLNLYALLSFMITAKNGFEANSIHSHWLTVAIVKVFLTYLYFRVTRRTFFQFCVATAMGTAVRLGMDGAFLAVIFACQFYLEFYDNTEPDPKN